MIANLSHEESEVAKKYSDESEANAFLYCRYVLRQILSATLNIPPLQIEFLYNKFGKPFLRQPGLNFNVSHSGGAYVIGIAQGVRIGVDLERLDREMDLSKIHAVLLTPNEQKLLKGKGVFSKEFFLDLWTKKEALLKAAGTGLAGGMNQLELVENIQTGGLQVSAQYGGSWTLESRTILGTYLVSVALENANEQADSLFKSSYFEL